MQIRELTIPDAYEITPTIIRDDRGAFLEWYRFDRLAEYVGHPLDLRQANTSVSKRGVLRGIHYADVPRGQAKYVTVTHGSVIDFVVDIRVGSPSFGAWDSVLLDDVDRRAIYLAEGLGHAFLALSDEAIVSYLVSDTYNPAAERAINPRDPRVALELPIDGEDLIVSAKDSEAPSLEESRDAGALPSFAVVQDFYKSLAV